MAGGWPDAAACCARACARRQEPVPVSRMLLPKVSRSTIAAQSRGPVKVLVQPPDDSLEAMATLLFFLPLGEDLEQQLGATLAELHVSQFVDLCRPRHKWIYADPGTMPRPAQCEANASWPGLGSGVCRVGGSA